MVHRPDKECAARDTLVQRHVPQRTRPIHHTPKMLTEDFLYGLGFASPWRQFLAIDVVLQLEVRVIFDSCTRQVERREDQSLAKARTNVQPPPHVIEQLVEREFAFEEEN